MNRTNDSDIMVSYEYNVGSAKINHLKVCPQCGSSTTSLSVSIPDRKSSKTHLFKARLFLA
jgi:hypothetical protein